MQFRSGVTMLGGATSESTSTQSTGSPAQTVSPAIVPQDPSVLSPTLPSWAREVGAVLATRPSRASSIISTRTRFSTTTIQDDARSVDINIGGHHFRISRDGSRITSEAPPPPYSGPGEAETILEEGPERNEVFPNSGSQQRSIASVHLISGQSAGSSIAGSSIGLRANILDP